MKWVLVPLLAVSLVAWAGEEKDPVAGLPGGLRPGASATFERAAGGGRLRAAVKYRAEAGKEKGTVELTYESKTADLGPLTAKERLTAVLDAAARRIVSFTYETASGTGADLRLASDLGPDPKKDGRLVFRRYDYTAKGERKTRTTRLAAPDGLFAPDPLEPFLVALLAPAAKESAEIGVMDVETGRLSRSSPSYRSLGEGKMRVGEEDVPCRILRRIVGERKTLVYQRAADRMPVRDEAAGLTLEAPGEPKKDEGR